MKRAIWFGAMLMGVVLMIAVVGCHHPTSWEFSGPRVFLIRGTPAESSDGLYWLEGELHQHEINATVVGPDDWLQVVNDIDAAPAEDAIIVGHGHGGFLATQVARHYAQDHKTKYMKRVIVIDAFNKDWPYAETNAKNPTPMPIGHNAQRINNYVQHAEDSSVNGTTLVSTRNSNYAEKHPYYWYDNYWGDYPVVGQNMATDVSALQVTHTTIDNNQQLLERILKLCRRSALTPCHYTPVRHYPYAAPDKERQEDTPTRQASAY